MAKIPHYKAKRVNDILPAGKKFKCNGIFFENFFNKYRWYTSNGNIYEYTLKT